MMSSENIILDWYNTYKEYLTHNGVSENHDELWSETTNNLIQYWENMEAGEVQQIYSSFQHFLTVQMDYYKKMNANYRRDIKNPKPLTVVKGTGGRWCL